MVKTLVVTLLLSLSGFSYSFAQQWQYTGSLSVPKQELTITVLNNGTILATGGMNQDMVAHSECELYDPATASWSLTGSMKIGRVLHSAVKLKDGRVAVFGGQTDGLPDGSMPVQTAQIEIYDPSTGAWSDDGQLLVARQHHTSSLLSDGRVLIVGGLSGVSPTASSEIYDPTTKISSVVASLQLARYEHQATSLSDGRVMVTGGRNGGWDGNFFNESEIYDPSTDTWTVIESMHQSRMRALLVQFSDGTILSAAGRNAPTSTAPGSEIYDLSTGHWTETDSMKQPCTWLSCVLFPNDCYLATGGFIDAIWTSSTQVTCTPTAEWYDKSNQRWFYAPQMEQARARHGSAYLHQTVNEGLPSDLILVAGGIIGDNSYTTTCEILDVTESSLKAYEAMPVNKTSSADVGIATAINKISVIYNGENSPVIEYSLSSSEDVSIRLVTMDGRVVKNYDQGSLAAGTYDLALSESQLPSGVYVAIIQAGATRSVEKLVISH